MRITIKRLPSGYLHVRGTGVCNWAQIPRWPLPAGESLEQYIFPEASKEFVGAAMLALDGWVKPWRTDAKSQLLASGPGEQPEAQEPDDEKDARIAELEGAIFESGGWNEMHKLDRAEIDALKAEVARWEAKEIARASTCCGQEERAEKAEAEVGRLHGLLERADALLPPDNPVQQEVSRTLQTCSDVTEGLRAEIRHLKVTVARQRVEIEGLESEIEDDGVAYEHANEVVYVRLANDMPTAKRLSPEIDAWLTAHGPKGVDRG